MRYLLLIFLSVIYCGTSLQSQDCEKGYPQAGPQIPGRIYYDNDKNAENSAFLYDEWREGTIQFNNGYKAENVGLRYQAFHDQLVYHNRSLNYAVVVERNYVKEFDFKDPVTNKILKFRKININTVYFQDSLGCFAQVLSDGRVCLYALRIRQKKPVNSSYQTKVEKYFYVDISLYYLQLANGEIVKFEPSNNSLRKILNDRRAELKTFMRKERLRVRKEEDLIRAVGYYNSL